MKHFVIVIIAVLLLPLLAKSVQAELRAAGSDSTATVVRSLFEAFQAKTGVPVKMTGGGSSVGAKAALNGEVDIAFLSRNLHESEKEAGLVEMPYAIDGVAVITNKTNPIDDISIENLRNLFSGKLKMWSNGKPFLLYNRDANSGTRECFEKKVMQGRPFSKRVRVATNLNIIGDAKRDPTAVGYTSASSVGKSIKVLRIDGIAPTPENLISGKYPICRTLVFATMGPPTGEAKAFLDFVKSPQGEATIKSAGYIPLCDSKRPEK